MATQNEVANHLDLSRQTVAVLLREGVLPAAKGPGGMDLDACRIAYIRNLRGKAAGRIRQAPEATDDSKTKLESERARLAFHQANAAELNEQVLRGELLKAGDVTREVSDAFRRVRARLLSLPTKITPIVVGSTDAVEVKEAIDRCIVEALDELARVALPLDDQAPARDT